ALRAQRRPVEVGSEALVGQWGVVDTELAPFGKVFVAGELWSAKVKDPSARVEAGKSVQVVSVEG
ncbi:MAG: nodulation protein NfeD, partial [Anaerolineae bacterium]|nr:nodulation protein NfeD [Anaerolineae bacterium]